MINKQIIAKALGGLLSLEALLMLLCMGVGLYFDEPALQTWLIPIAVTLTVGSSLWFYGRGAKNKFGRRDGYLVVGSTWFIFSLFGMVPFLTSHCTDRLSVAFFETMSGFTTTGATAFPTIELLPHSILFWRSLMHWLGGMGIIFFTIAVLPTLGIGEQKVFAAETTGVKIGKLHPRISTTAHWLWSLYFLLTASCAGAYYLCGMSLWDAINHALSTLATGGFSTHTDSIGWFHSPQIEYVAIFFMWMASVNFSLTYLIIVKHRFKQAFADNELRAYMGINFAATLIFAAAYLYASVDVSQLDFSLASLISLGKTGEASFRNALFHAVSIQTSTGFGKHDFMLWPPICWMVVIFISICGGCSGSTSGGIKVVRLVFLWKIIKEEFLHILHPRAVLPIRLNGETVENTVLHSVVAYLLIYAILVLLGTTAMVLFRLPMFDAFGLTITSLSNIGPALGHYVGATGSWDILPDGAIWIQSFLMLAGRLEIFSLFLPFVPEFWSNR